MLQVVTLTKHRGWDKPEDEQLHVLPLYVPDSTDEYGSKEGQDKKVIILLSYMIEKKVWYGIVITFFFFC